MKKVAFHSNQLGIRGTEVALYDYACGNEDVLNNKSYIISDKNKDMVALPKFRARFEGRIFLYDDFAEVEDFLKQEGIEYIYYIKAGDNDGKLVSNATNLVHAVFQNYTPHGEKYVYIAQWLAKKMCGDSSNYVPHIISLPAQTANIRELLNIPDDATVLGRHGGLNEFDFEFTKRAIAESLNLRGDLYYIFMNTTPFINHDRVKFIQGTHNLQNKSNFICSCDAMIHGRQHGETFGLAIGEFLYHDKPIILCKHGYDQGHHSMVHTGGHWYSDYDSCLRQLLNFRKNNFGPGTYKKLVSEYTAENVMNSFNLKFLG